MKLFFVAGEASGDARGAELMRALSEQEGSLNFEGAGGPKMKALAGTDFFDWADEAVVGLWDVLKKYGYFRRQFARLLNDILRLQPAAVILIDYPGFNLRLAKAIRARRPAQKIIYYISPQVWAWHRGRIPKMARWLDLMLCIFPFEEPLYNKSGLRTVFVGHPLVDSLAAQKTNEPRDPGLVGLFPGSREKEVRKIFPTMLASASQMQKNGRKWRFEASAASPSLAELMRELVAQHGSELSCDVGLHTSHALMQRAAAGMVTSGTATLEAAYFGMPLVIIYKVAWLTWEVGRRLVRVEFLGMPNLLAGREIAREFLQDAAVPERIAEEMTRLLEDPEARLTAQTALAAVVEKLGGAGAAERAAAIILQTLR